MTSNYNFVKKKKGQISGMGRWTLYNCKSRMWMFTCYNGSRFLDEELAISAPRAQAPALSTIAICQIIHYFICQIIFSVISPIFWKKSTISSYNFKNRRHIMRLGGVYFFRNASQLFQCRTYKKFLHMLLKTFPIS